MPPLPDVVGEVRPPRRHDRSFPHGQSSDPRIVSVKRGSGSHPEPCPRKRESTETKAPFVKGRRLGGPDLSDLYVASDTSPI